jgi:hypothetical protein
MGRGGTYGRAVPAPPAQPSLPPVQPSLPPVQPSLPPVQPSLPPVQPSLPPAQPSLSPVQPSLPPVQPSLPPVSRSCEQPVSGVRVLAGTGEDRGGRPPARAAPDRGHYAVLPAPPDRPPKPGPTAKILGTSNEHDIRDAGRRLAVFTVLSDRRLGQQGASGTRSRRPSLLAAGSAPAGGSRLGGRCGRRPSARSCSRGPRPAGGSW